MLMILEIIYILILIIVIEGSLRQWIGLIDEILEGKFYWEYFCSVFNFIFWVLGEFFEGEIDNCGVIKCIIDCWFIIFCIKMYFFICEG